MSSNPQPNICAHCNPVRIPSADSNHCHWSNAFEAREIHPRNASQLLSW